MQQNNYVAIMAGGIGSRFWPMSRSSYPKQFLDILNTGKTLLQSTYDRFLAFIPNENIFIVTAEEYVTIVKEQLPNLPVENIIGEPERKNTAACVAYMAFKLKQLNADANMIVAPSDHLIDDQQLFEDTCMKALEFTKNNQAFVTLGIKPTYANTGYGYIQYKNCAHKENIYPVIRFTEKPNLEKATEFFKSDDYLWNSGIFIWTATNIIQAFRNYMPEMFDIFVGALPDLNTPLEQAAIKHIYKYCESVSIDYAIMEKAQNVFVIPSSFKWSDLGTWTSAWEISDKDIAQNAIAGNNTLMVDAKGCIVHSNDKKLLLVGGVEDLIIVNTPDAILICKKENEQQIKEYLTRVKQVKGDTYL
ncbi:MAG: mannose-1-phosphate guanylyltransferase [Ferruginibacter sp.]